MADPLTLHSRQDCPTRPRLAYRVELRRADDEAPTVIAEGSSPGIGYAAYYAALREHFGEHLALTCDGRQLASSGRRD